jgi:archaellum biogenesis ATPase FlaH
MYRNLDTDPYKGIERGRGKYIPTGLPTIDYAMNDLEPGCVTIIAGRSNEGKTTVVRQIVCNAITVGAKVCVINGEGIESRYINELYRCVLGNRRELFEIVKINKRNFKEPNAEGLALVQQWHKGKLTINHARELDTLENLFKGIEKEIVENKHDLVIMDNLMSLLSAVSNEKNEKQSDFIQKCHILAEKYMKHIILVVHPNKDYRTGVEPTFEQISGTSDIYNKADNVLWVRREWNDLVLSAGTDGEILLLKVRWFSKHPSCMVSYNKETGLLCEIKDGEIQTYDFKIDNHISIDRQSEVKNPFDL